jgi:hypothetical protein
MGGRRKDDFIVMIIDNDDTVWYCFDVLTHNILRGSLGTRVSSSSGVCAF